MHAQSVSADHEKACFRFDQLGEEVTKVLDHRGFTRVRFVP
jgi:hypothetical protein